MKILLDMDGVIAQYIPALIEEYNFLTNEHLKEEDIRDFNIGQYVNDPMLVKRITAAVGFISGLEPYDDAIEAVKTLKSKGHEVIFVSTPTNCPTSAHEKREWLNYYFSKLWSKAPLITCPAELKREIRGDVLVDDDPRNLANLHATTKPLLWHTKQNASAVGFERLYSWDQFLDWVERNG